MLSHKPVLWHSFGQLGLDCLAWLVDGSTGLPALRRCVAGPLLGASHLIFRFLCDPFEVDVVCIGMSFIQMGKQPGGVVPFPLPLGD